MRKSLTFVATITVAGVTLAAGCGSDDTADPAPATDAGSAATDGEPSDGEALQIVVTTSILGDIVSSAVGDLAEVEVIIPVGADSHDFQPSAKQAEAMEDADLLVTNGLNLEEGLTSVIEAVEASGTPVFAITDHVELLDGEEHADEEHSEGDEEHAEGEEEHADEEHAEGEGEHSEGEEDHHHEGGDPHVWMDPTRMIVAVEALADELAALGLDAAELDARIGAYTAELAALDAEVDEVLSAVVDERRVMVTNHEAFGYFADRYRFEILGAVVPSLTTNAEASARQLEELAALITSQGVPAIFAETTESTQLAEAVAAEVGGEVEIVELFTESLGEEGSGAETYAGFMTTNANRIAAALG